MVEFFREVLDLTARQLCAVLLIWLCGDLVVLLLGLGHMLRRRVRAGIVLAWLVTWPYHIVLVARDLGRGLVCALRLIFAEAARETRRFLSWW